MWINKGVVKLPGHNITFNLNVPNTFTIHCENDDGKAPKVLLKTYSEFGVIWNNISVKPMKPLAPAVNLNGVMMRLYEIEVTGTPKSIKSKPAGTKDPGNIVTILTDGPDAVPQTAVASADCTYG